MKIILKSMLFVLSLGALFCCNGRSKVEEPRFKMKATVERIGEKIEVNVYEAEYASGADWLVIGDKTKYEGSDGKAISLADISPGDKIEVTYNGQVMMSYPPQIAALKIRKI